MFLLSGIYVGVNNKAKGKLFFFFFLRPEFCYVSQVGLELTEDPG